MFRQLKSYGLVMIVLQALLLISNSNNISAQVLHITDAVGKTLANYPLIKQRQAEVAAGQAHITTINGYRLPALVLHGEALYGTANSVEGAYFPMGIIPSVSGSLNSSENTNLSTGDVALSLLQWEFYNFGYYKAQTNLAQAQLATSQAGLNSDTYLLSQDIISLYLDWLKKYRLLRIEDENMQRYNTVLTAIRATVNSGLKAGVDSSTAAAAYSEARVAYLQALDNYTADKIAIATYTGADTTALQPDTSIAANAQTAALQLPASDSVAPDHPLLDIYQKQYQLQLASNNAIAKRYLPRFNLLGAAWARGSSISSTENYSSDLGNPNENSRYNYLLGLSLTYNITDIKHRHDMLMEGNYMAQASQDALQTQQINMNKMLQQADAAYATTMQKLQELPVQLDAARLAYTQQLALYRSGLNTLIDLTNASYVLAQAETNLVLAQDELLQVLYIRAGLGNQLDAFLQNFK